MAQTTLKCLGFGLAAVAAIGATMGTAAPAAIPAVVVALNAALGSVAGSYLTDLCKLLHQPAARHFLEGRLGIDENGRVASALRLAHLKALREVQHRFDAIRAADHDPDRRRAADRFSTELTKFITAETKAAHNADFHNPTNLAEDEQRLRDDVLRTLPATFDQGLAARRATGDTTAIVRTLAEIRATVETAVLAEIRLRIAILDEPLPPAFQWAFDGTGYPDSWFDLFIRDAAEKITAIPAFGDIWKTEQLSLIRAIADAHTAAIARIETTQFEHTAMLQELLTRTDFLSRAREQGIAEARVRIIVERLGGQGIERDDLIPWLDNWIEAAQQQLGRHTNEGEAFEAAWREAERRFRSGQSGKASSAFMDELAREQRRAAEQQAESKRKQIRLLEAGIEFDELEVDAPAAVAKLHMIAAIDGITDPDALGLWLYEKANTFYERGRDKGTNAALVIAIAIHTATLDVLTRGRVPLDWATTQNNLGIALRTLGERESGTARLQEAVAAYRAALEERTRDRVPLDWAATQNNLGAALATLGVRESGTARLEQAVATYRAALEERTRDRVPLDWAMTQNNLGAALQTLGVRESGTARLEEAVAAYRAALEEYTRDRVPLDWAMTQNNLGTALQTLGERESGTARLEEAVAAYRAALEEYTRDRVPLDWAMTQNNLGNALQTLGERESGTARLEEAVAAYRAALEEYTRDRVPLDWAMTQNNLGNALRALGARESGTARLEEAVAAYRAALEERTRDRIPLDWAASFGNQGVALMHLADRTDDPALATTALDQITTAFTVLHDGGHATFAAYFEQQLPNAHAVVARLSRA